MTTSVHILAVGARTQSVSTSNRPQLLSAPASLAFAIIQRSSTSMDQTFEEPSMLESNHAISDGGD